MDRLTSLFVFLLLTAHGSLLTAQADELLVGTAKLELTPAGKVPLAGYSRRKGKAATGVHDPLFVRALAMQHGQTRVVIASCDLLIIDERLFEAVQRRVIAEHRDPPLHLLLTATHTHSGPGAYGQAFFEKLSMGHYDPEVFAFLVDRIAATILQAAAHLHPARIRSQAAATSGFVVNRMEPRGLVDAELIVVVVEDPSQHPRAVLVNFNAHPTTLGAWNRELSADYPGVVAQRIEQRYPGSVCLFLPGAVGDQAPVKQGTGFEAATSLGEALVAQAVPLIEARSSQPVGVGGSMVWVDASVRLPPARLRLDGARLPSWLSRFFVDDDASVSALAVGTGVFMGLPCDVSAELGLELKRRARASGYDHPIVVGFANDYIGYCLPERLYWTDHYEARMAFNGPMTGELLVNEVTHLMDQLAASR